MDYTALAELMFPQIHKTPQDYEAQYPPRQLPQGAMVTRMAPSPTGFMHLGNLFGAVTDERLAHQSGGIFYLRIEDTDAKREVEGGVETILSVFRQFGLQFDEGATLAESTMAALLDGPQEWELHAIIPDGFWINGVRVEEGVCILSLPSDALALLPEEREAQEQILLSIAKTIYSWGTVDEIQLLVDGEPSTSFGEVPVEEVQFRPVEEAE